MDAFWKIRSIAYGSDSVAWVDAASGQAAIIRAFGHDVPESRQLLELAMWLSAADLGGLRELPVGMSFEGKVAFSGAVIGADGRLLLVGTSFRVLAGGKWVTEPPPHDSFSRLGMELAVIHDGRFRCDHIHALSIPNDVDFAIVTDLANYRLSVFEAWLKSWPSVEDLIDNANLPLPGNGAIGAIEEGSVTILLKARR